MADFAHHTLANREIEEVNPSGRRKEEEGKTVPKEMRKKRGCSCGGMEVTMVGAAVRTECLWGWDLSFPCDGGRECGPYLLVELINLGVTNLLATGISNTGNVLGVKKKKEKSIWKNMVGNRRKPFIVQEMGREHKTQS